MQHRRKSSPKFRWQDHDLDVTGRPTWRLPLREHVRPLHRLQRRPQCLVRLMRVDQRRRDVAVPQGLLDDPEVPSALQQVYRKRVPQPVDADALGDARPLQPAAGANGR